MKPQPAQDISSQAILQEQESVDEKDQDQDMQQEQFQDEDVKMDLDRSHDQLNQSNVSAASLRSDGHNVEDRLKVMDTIYKQRREEKLKAAAEERNKSYAMKPTINKKSEKIAKKKEGSGIKVEDRLMNYAKKKKSQEADSKIMNDSVQNSSKVKKSTQAQNSQVVSRLMDYGKYYKQKQIEREQEFFQYRSFKPDLKKSSNYTMNKSKNKVVCQSQAEDTESQNFLKYIERNASSLPNESPRITEPEYENYIEEHLYDNSPIKEPTRKVQKIKDEYDRNHPFHPNINKTSKFIVDQQTSGAVKDANSEGVHNRLYNLYLTKKGKEEEKLNFKPDLNKNSEEIIRLMKEGNDYDQNERWKSLYNYGVMKQKVRKEIEDEIKIIRENEAVASQPYHPQILPYETNQQESKDIVERSKEWAASIECKKEVLAESYFRNIQLKDLQECTFKPKLIAEEKLRERNMTASEFGSKMDVSVNPKSLESFYRRMEDAHTRKRELEDHDKNFCGSGNNWENKLTVAKVPEFHERNQQVSLEQVRCLTKPVIRNGEIVKDPVFQIDRHENYKKSLQTNALRSPTKEDVEYVRGKKKEPLFENDVDFED